MGEVAKLEPQVPAALQAERDKSMAALVLSGDLSKLDAKQKMQVYVSRCEALGLNWRAQPYDYLKLSGKEVLYLSARGVAQLKKRDNISCKILERRAFEDAGANIYFVAARAEAADGRFEEASAEVVITGSALDRCNLRMKCETKAKSRATKMLGGEAAIDESEIDAIPGAVKVDGPMPSETVDAEVVEAKTEEKAKGNGKPAAPPKPPAKPAAKPEPKPEPPPAPEPEPTDVESQPVEEGYAGDDYRNALKEYAKEQGYDNKDVGTIMKDEFGINAQNIATAFTMTVYNAAMEWFQANPKGEAAAEL